MRLVSQETHNAIESNKNAPANFGLVFNKWLVFNGFEPIVNRNKQPLIDSYGKSSKQAEEILKQRHIQQAKYCQAMEKAGWRSFVVHARLTSPFVSGLGMTHPTETGMVLDHTSGMPYIPAASQKGVMRLAHVINSLLDDEGNWKNLDELLEQEIIQEVLNKNTQKMEPIWREDNAGNTLFGFSEKKNSLAGQLVVLDAYPLNPPSLGEEILNPHFIKYYGGERGPTEDQSPIPIKFLVVKQGAEFVFRLLLRRPLDNAPEKDQEKLAGLIEKNLRRAINEEGMGAKTSLGFGRFEVLATGEPQGIQNWIQQKQKDAEEEARLAAKQAAAEREQQALAAMTEVERDVYTIQKADTSDEVINSIYKKLNGLSPEDQKVIALALKNFWEMTSKWSNKQCSSAQWEKVKKVKTFLITEPAADLFTAEEQIAMELIDKLSDWGAWKNAGIALETLPLPALKKLREKFNTWKIKDGKGNKPATWKTINRLIQQMTKQ